MMFRTAVGRPGGMPACIDSLVAEPVDVIMVPGAARVASERAKAADLPPQQIEEYEVGVNLAVARRLGIEVSPSFLLRADRVYEDETGKADGRLRPRY